MKDFDLGYMEQDAADLLTDALHGKSYMGFMVGRGTTPGGTHVTLASNSDYDAEDMLTMALHLLACHSANALKEI